MTALGQTMLEDMRVRSLEPHPQKAYIGCAAAFARQFGRSPDHLGPDEIGAYLLHLRDDRHLSASTIIQAYCTLRFLYRVTLGRDWTVEKLQFPKRELPAVLGESEVERLLRCVRKLKHRAMLLTIYAGGLRVSEACILRVNDIDSDRMVMTIRQELVDEEITSLEVDLALPTLVALSKYRWHDDCKTTSRAACSVGGGHGT